MTKFIANRLVKAVFTVWFIVTFVFVAARLTGDPADWLLPDDASEAAKTELRVTLGLDRPIVEQYTKYILSVGRGDMGESYEHHRSVSELYAQRVGPTLRIGLIAFVLSVASGILLGVFAAIHRNSLLDRITMGIAISGYALPHFVFAILLIFLFSLVLRILPSGGMDHVSSYIMPVMVMCLSPTASIARLTRSSMLDVLKQDYLDFARSKGTNEFVIIFKHALRNALIPIVTVAGVQIGTLIGGSIIVEQVFAWPGVGSLIVAAARGRDYPLIQYAVLIVASTVTLANMLVDISYAYLDPRIREKF